MNRLTNLDGRHADYNRNQQIPTFTRMEGLNDYQCALPELTFGSGYQFNNYDGMQPMQDVNGASGQEVTLVEAMAKEVEKFSKVMKQLAQTMHERMKKAEHERDVALGRIVDMEKAVIQSAPQLGYGRFRDAEDECFPAPMTPSPGAASDDEEYTPFHEFQLEAPKKKIVRGKAPNGLSSILSSEKTPSTRQTPNRTLKFINNSITPNRMGPDSGSMRPKSVLRKVHAKKVTTDMVSSNALIPAIPLTDTEIIVFFYQSVARPVVAMRLYARSWGPVHITDVLNMHRGTDYLRNTCSVKCIASINKGKSLYGADWATGVRKAFKEADDAKATDLIRFSEADYKTTRVVDCELKKLAKGVKVMPKVGKDAGLFTKCVHWCVENDGNYRLSNVELLAHRLRDVEAAEKQRVARGGEVAETRDFAEDMDLEEEGTETNEEDSDEDAESDEADESED